MKSSREWVRFGASISIHWAICVRVRPPPRLGQRPLAERLDVLSADPLHQPVDSCELRELSKLPLPRTLRKGLRVVGQRLETHHLWGGRLAFLLNVLRGRFLPPVRHNPVKNLV